MKQFVGSVLVLCVVAMAGCKYFETKYDLTASERRRAANEEMVNVPTEEQVRNAVIAQHTIFPHHFVSGTDELNAIGRRDLLILAGHYKDHPGPVGMRPEGTCCKLDEARVAAVKGFLEHEGVDVAALTIGDAYPGGDGMASTRVLKAVSAEEQASTTETTEGSGASGLPGGS